MDKLKIPFLHKCTSLHLIEEGFSDDEKWCVDNTYLLRMSPKTEIGQLVEQAKLTNEVHALDPRIPYVYDVGVYENRTYMILDYMIGENGNITLPIKIPKVQYEIGLQVGNALKNMHSIVAPDDYPSWEETWKARFDNQAPRFEEIVRRHPNYASILPFIQDNLYLLKNRPSCIQHFDFHPGNILIHEDRFTGLIDMQKIRYADPINEFYKMEYFNVQVSRAYSCGVVEGYHDEKSIPNSFWEMHRLYAAMHLVFAEVWGHEGGIDQMEKFQSYTRFTLDQFDEFRLLIPKWYENKWIAE
ncbi:aminoglycoside phosphotransferase family protein [Psychrobacillus soli]|uniref:Aminoglycoside phosphotransferase family protein n=1 Tax=Psychrobacillus soli TaxID=1543965 RepID=A0A544TM48_9BACI|nr:aminoglycoside phosphotransferase family protein [Psychrobacillus soli]TQR18508.1 aminoglycoside phosphotransferase family protein [Psychrobacillus soli]